MKTIKEIADEIGVSKQAIQKRINKEPLYTSIQQYISTIEGTKYIEVDGIELIKSAYQRQPTTKVTDNISTNQSPTADNEVYSILRETITTLRGQLEVKDEQIKAKDEQIFNLTEINKNLSESINTDRKNELAGTIIDGQKQLANGTVEKKKGIFGRIFKKGEPKND